MGYKVPAKSAPEEKGKVGPGSVLGGGVKPEASGLLGTLSSVPMDILGATGAEAIRSVAPEQSRVSMASSDSESESNPRVGSRSVLLLGEVQALCAVPSRAGVCLCRCTRLI
jgi:hypothetical protein